MGPTPCHTGTPTGGAGSTTYGCYWSGDTGRISVLLWRDAANTIPIWFGIERTLDATGTPTSDGVTLITVGPQDNGGYARQQTLGFNPSVIAFTKRSGIISLWPLKDNPTSLATGLNVPVSPIFPLYSTFGNPMTICASGGSADITEASTVTMVLYGSSRTFLCTKNGMGFQYFNSAENNTVNGLMMRYD